MSYDSQDIIKRAVESIADEADGNGVTRDQVRMDTGHVEERELWWFVTCKSIVHQKSGKTPGDSGIANIKLLPDAQQCRQAVAHYDAELSKHPEFGEWPMQVVNQRTDLGFDTTKTPVVVASTKRTFGFKSTCGTCGGRKVVQCSACAGRGQVNCINCGGTGRRSCSSCGGSGQVTDYDYSRQQTVLKSCPACSLGSVQCNACLNGRVTCTACGGSGTVRCAPCEGAGFFTEWTEVACAGELSGGVNWGNVPAAHQTALNKIGVPNLVYGHADIKRTKTEGPDHLRRVSTFHVTLPVGEVTAMVGDHRFTFDVVGIKARTVPRQAFLETIAASGADALEKAGTGSVRLSKRRLRNAMKFDIVRAAIDACCRGIGVGPMQSAYPSLDERQARWWMNRAQDALKNVNRRLARRWRLVCLAITFFAVVAWFPMELREMAGADSDAYFVYDPAVVLGLPLMSALWIRWRQKRRLFKIWYACRRDPNAKRKKYKYSTGGGLPPLRAGIEWLILGLVLALIIAFESGWQTKNFLAPGWDTLRQPIAPATDWAWDHLEPQLTRLVDYRVEK